MLGTKKVLDSYISTLCNETCRQKKQHILVILQKQYKKCPSAFAHQCSLYQSKRKKYIPCQQLSNCYAFWRTVIIQKKVLNTFCEFIRFYFMYSYIELYSVVHIEIEHFMFRLVFLFYMNQYLLILDTDK